MTSRPPVHLPVEIKTRELDGTLLLACVLAERGRRVLVGARHHLKHRFGRSVYLGRTVTASVATIYRRKRDVGNLVVALDEEGLVIYSREIYRARRLGRETVRIPHALFAWGEANAELWREELGDGARTVHVTGNPRFDLLRAPLREIYRPEAERLRRRFGRYLLFNSNFHWVNTRHKAYTRLPDPEDVASGRFPMPPFYNPDLARHRIALFRAYLEALPRLARAFPDLHLVIRPHPAEDPEPWRRATADLANVTVLYEGEVTPWILGSVAVLHHSCTTAVESFVLERPVLCYRPLVDEALDPELPIRLSLEAHDPDALVAGLRRLLAGGDAAGRAAREAHLRRHLEAVTGPLAADRIAGVIDALDPPPPPPARRLRAALWFGKKRLRAFRRRFRHKPFADLFPPTPVAEIEARIRAFGELLGRFEGVRVTELATNLYRIERHVRP